MTQHQFGGDWTDEKLERIRKYLTAYMRIFKGNPRARMLHTTYVDAFAGTGYRSPRKQKSNILPIFENEPEREAYIKGSSKIALEIDPAFDSYLFIENDIEYVTELQKLKNAHPEREESITIISDEANKYLKDWCNNNNWIGHRAVIFLDPYGMQVDWSLMEAIAKTKAIDLWLLFPLGMAVNRLLTRQDTPPKGWSDALTRIFGTNDWQNAFYTTKTDLTLFGLVESNTKIADFEIIGRFFVDRLKTIFPHVAENPLPLRNSMNNPLYLLCFAASNPEKGKTAVKIAEHILRR